MTRLELDSGWAVLQDVHDSGERLGLPSTDAAIGTIGSQLSEWEPIARLEHLQLLFHQLPYWGRALRSFNAAPWWYRNEFTAPVAPGEQSTLRFSNVDYFAKVWLNGELLGEHEGYALPFEFDVTDRLRLEGPNRLIVRVWSPWDTELRDENWEMRFARVRRRMVKGTYEHDDGFIARDVNPVGVYGSVTLTTFTDARVGVPEVSFELDVEKRSAAIRVAGQLQGGVPVPDPLKIELISPAGDVVVTTEATIADGRYFCELTASDLALWETWDRGTPNLYRVRATTPSGAVADVAVGFRAVDLVRNETHTQFLLNGRRLYVRGASYFPDVYLSRLDEPRLRRDLEFARDAGLNLLRVHVHTEPTLFYDLCDELGIGLLQDSDFNWDHPETEEWTDVLVSSFSEVVRHLKPHPSVFAWIAMNEPGVFVAEQYLHVRPGPQLVAAARLIDPTRPVIKGSGMEQDPESRDSHNYHGSLAGESTHYTDIDGTTERLNTEFGFDSPGKIENLRTTGALFQRLEGIQDILPELQDYQYRLLKYYIEHYRLQRFSPCSGYVQFMLIDLGPQSYYGVWDWWGDPKPGLNAFLESGQPVAVILAQTGAESSAIWLINDTLQSLGQVRVSWRAVSQGVVLAEGDQALEVQADSMLQVAPLPLRRGDHPIGVELTVIDASGAKIATNRYQSLFDHPAHPAGHPGRLSEEYGSRLFSIP